MNTELNDKKTTRPVRKRKKHRFKRTKGDVIFNILNYTFFIVFTLICIFPFYYLFINTISDNELVRTGQINFLPRGIHINNYLMLTNVNDLGTSAYISIARTVIGTAVMVFASALVGYLVTKKEMWGRKIVYRFIIITMYFNAGLIPWYLNMSMLGLTNNFWGYVIPGVISPFNIILVKTYIESIPAEMEESAFMDGAGHFMIFRKIIWPLSKPILATIAVFGAVGHWNNFIDSMILMSNRPQLYTLQYRLYIYLQTSNNLAELMRGGQVSQAALNAALNARTVKLTVAMITIVPILLVYPFMSRYFEKGIMIGAVKG